MRAPARGPSAARPSTEAAAASTGASADQTRDPPRDDRHHLRYLVVGEHTVQHERMQVDVEIERATETPHDDHGAAATIGHVIALGATPEEPQHRPHED